MNKSNNILRLPENYRDWLKKKLSSFGKPFLFGSRTNLKAKGGDIDVLILSENKISFTDLANIRKDFILQFGDQKLDLVNFTFNDKKAFKKLILSDAIAL